MGGTPFTPPAQIRVKPEPGRTVPKSDGSTLADDGETVRNEGHWFRRMLDGDVSIELLKEKK